MCVFPILSTTDVVERAGSVVAAATAVTCLRPLGLPAAMFLEAGIRKEASACGVIISRGLL